MLRRAGAELGDGSGGQILPRSSKVPTGRSGGKELTASESAAVKVLLALCAVELALWGFVKVGAPSPAAMAVSRLARQHSLCPMPWASYPLPCSPFYAAGAAPAVPPDRPLPSSCQPVALPSPAPHGMFAALNQSGSYPADATFHIVKGLVESRLRLLRVG